VTKVPLKRIPVGGSASDIASRVSARVVLVHPSGCESCANGCSGSTGCGRILSMVR
jgi:hypothetical protein